MPYIAMVSMVVHLLLAYTYIAMVSMVTLLSLAYPSYIASVIGLSLYCYGFHSDTFVIGLSFLYCFCHWFVLILLWFPW